MIRNRLIAAGALACAASTVAVGAASAASAHHTPSAHAASGGAVVDMVKSNGHTILVDRNGLALYIFTKDRGTHNSCAPTSGCSSVWPTYYTNGRPIAGRGVNARLLGTTQVGKRQQVTYAGHPLYEYASKQVPGFVSYIGVSEFGGAWDAISPSGSIVR